MLDVIATLESNDDMLDYYSKIGYMELNNYYKNFMTLSRFRLKHKFPINSKNSFAVATINAFYSASENRIEVTPGILQPPVYYTDAPIALNFAAIGTLIGHEITHGFDDSGSQYDETGKEINWWAKSTKEKYDEKVKCFEDQYSSYTEPKTGLKVDGELTIGDNIADNGGLHQSFTAYRMYSSENPEMNLRLPGNLKKYTPEQLFFISYGSIWCENNSLQFAKEQITQDEHAPARFRTIVPLSNLKEFAAAFKCASGTPMNPVNKCVLW
ncbi:peptidase family M13-like protein [Leptotrombidium deliense]|uniref:Peptidase family M13-like protein n=1 Tax=Leptotrombidium deliense TaxID=299467 RepID=A0A443S3Q8_9ACAR|nr:peptidase family M13-like protein [Leptotrombidium deliense]